jgi:hypothetical protein
MERLMIFNAKDAIAHQGLQEQFNRWVETTRFQVVHRLVVARAGGGCTLFIFYREKSRSAKA